MIMSFAKDNPGLDPIFIEGHELTPVISTKILGVYIFPQILNGTAIIFHIVSKASKRLYLLFLRLKRARVSHASLITVYTTYLFKGPFIQAIIAAIFLLLMHAIKWIDLRMY